MKTSIRIFLIGILTLLFCYYGVSQVIPGERIVDWSATLNSYDYKIPVKTLNVIDFGATGNGVDDDQPAIVSAITALNGELGYIYFPPGKYLLLSPIHLPDSVILKGENPSDCELRFDLNKTNQNCISIDKTQEFDDVFLDGGYIKDSKMIYSDSAFVFNPGDYAIISQTNGDWDDKPINWATDVVGQIVEIENVYGDTIYLKNALRITYNDTLTPNIKKINVSANIGITCLKIKRLDKPELYGGSNIYMRYALNCFVTGVESDTSVGSHINIFNSARILIEGCYIHHSFEYDGASMHGYGVSLSDQTGECLITDNIFEHLRHAMMVKTGANGNVFSYNYSTDVFSSEWPNNTAGDISLHGHYAYANLFEGNIVQNIIIDHYWGPSGPYNTIFRNRAELYGVIMTTGDPHTSDEQNFVGNEITNSSFPFGQYFLTGNNQFEFGNNVLGSIEPEGTTTLNDSSYYLTEQPYFWDPSLNWPSIGIPNTLGDGSIPAYERYANGEPITYCNDTVVNIGENSIFLKIDLWPNPTHDYLNMHISGYEGEIELQIFDFLGIKVLEKKINIQHEYKDKIDLGNIVQSGLLYINFKSAEFSITKKLLVFR